MGDVSLITNDLKLAKQQQDHHAQHECQNYNAEVHQPKNSVRTKGSAGEKTLKVYKDKYNYTSSMFHPNDYQYLDSINIL